jgi:hypothetical protein
MTSSSEKARAKQHKVMWLLRALMAAFMMGACGMFWVVKTTLVEYGPGREVSASSAVAREVRGRRPTAAADVREVHSNRHSHCVCSAPRAPTECSKQPEG